MDNNAKHTNGHVDKDVAIETGSALASGAAFAMLGAIIGRKIGSFASSKRHQITSKIGMWAGGALFSTLSLYASFRNRVQRAEMIENLIEENVALKTELLNQSNVADVKPTNETLPETKPQPVVHGTKQASALQLADHHNQL